MFSCIGALLGGGPAENYVSAMTDTDPTRRGYIRDLINGLVDDGVWSKLKYLGVVQHDSNDTSRCLKRRTSPYVWEGATAIAGKYIELTSTTGYLSSAYEPPASLDEDFTFGTFMSNTQNWNAHSLGRWDPALSVINALSVQLYSPGYMVGTALASPSLLHSVPHIGKGLISGGRDGSVEKMYLDADEYTQSQDVQGSFGPWSSGGSRAVWHGNRNEGSAAPAYAGVGQRIHAWYGASSLSNAEHTALHSRLDTYIRAMEQISGANVVNTYDHEGIFDASSEMSGSVSGAAFSSDGTKMYLAQWTNDIIFEYDLSRPFAAKSAVYNSASVSLSATITGVISSLRFSPDGSKLFVLTSVEIMYQFPLFTPWDIASVGTLTASYDFSSVHSDLVIDFCFNPSGTVLWLLHAGGYDRIYEVTLSTGYTLSGGVTVTGSFFTCAGIDAAPAGIEFNKDGTQAIYHGHTGPALYRLDMTTPYDITTCSYSGISGAIPVPVTPGPSVAWNYMDDYTQAILLDYNGGAPRVRQFSSFD